MMKDKSTNLSMLNQHVIRLAVAAILLVSSSLSFAQTAPTHCQTSPVTVSYDPAGARLLVACDDSFPDDVLWNLDRADQISGVLDGRFNKRIDGTGSVIYVLDSGVLAAHDEFMTATGSKVIAGIDALAPAGPLPCNVPSWALEPCANSEMGSQVDGHGTAVASAAAGNRVGVAPGAKLVAVRAFSGFTGLRLSVLMTALARIIEHAWNPTTPQFRTAVVTVSIGLSADGVVPPEVEAKIRQMIGGVDRDGNADPVNGKRFLFTFFGGNANANHCDAGGNPRVVPTLLGAQIKGAITVGGLAKPNELWSNSCRGSGIEVLAPADDVLVASLTGHDHYRPASYSSGTSYAAPYVAGIAARLLQVNPNLTPEELEDLIESTPARTSNGERVAVFVEVGERRRAVGR
jgi:subtilisin family serine protease